MHGPHDPGQHRELRGIEGRRIGTRTRAALAAAKARGVVLGKPENLRRNVQERQQAANAMAGRLLPIFMGLEGLSLREKAVRLTQIGIPAPKGGTWTHVQVGRVERRLVHV